VELDEEVRVIVDASAFNQMAFLGLQDSRDVGEEQMAKSLGEKRPAFFRAEDDVNVEACK
jgi:hypothetical protein